ncbi:MAG: type II toxin-antitoxin system RelE/ParE family toxin [Candidatus Cloacimonetes bacterium]|nr:type II toxin-antitoxin system RelE/ParE family toxin [Candidatus Cloacimonadota bacterium]MCF7812995.1 type II toxin-antitoxin system RelE/ParE family toxin [Candidatus Cloacimonadota bacterium]MCF7867273.1 type II toxin-antitoxin system RelE/ParE family toxin [Candidatus Cloacimonadota bacterium]MCF7882717.1 type II toxin-antitoxin system RelE/ParE family toxin [Candidatus Cloacimonadota bacterium]
MKYGVKFHKKAVEEFKRIDPVWQRRIKAKILQLAENPASLKHNLKALKGNLQDLFRLRVGSYRIIFQKKENDLIIIIIRIAHRREVY